MGKFLLFLVFGAIFVFGTFSRSMNEKIDDSVDNAVEHFERATVRNIDNSVIALGLRELSDNVDWRAGFTDLDVDGGTAALTVRDSVVGGESAIVLLSTSTYGQETTSSRIILKIGILSGSVESAVITTLEGFDKNGNSGNVSGNDAATTSDCPEGGQPPLPGVTSPDGLVTKDGQPLDGSEPWLAGDPPYNAGGTQADVAAQIDVDWKEVLALTPDYVVNTKNDWPGPSAFSGGQWPVIFVGPGVKLNGAGMGGQGLLVAPQTLEMSGSWTWDGLVLVGDYFRTNGGIAINGALLSGLNILLGQTVTGGNVANGNVTIQYHSCNIVESFEATAGKVGGSWRKKLELISWWE